jgi:hypothetical protein
MTTTASSVEEALVVHQFPSGERGEVRAYLQPYEGELLAHLRRYERRRDGQYVPTRKGIAVRRTSSATYSSPSQCSSPLEDETVHRRL